MNPFDVLPDPYRKYTYAIFGLAFLALAAHQASEGNWVEGVMIFLGSLGFGQATAKTPGFLSVTIKDTDKH